MLPAGFRLELPAETYALRHSDVWRPARIDYTRQPPRNLTAYTVFARLAPGVELRAGAGRDDAARQPAARRGPEHGDARTRVKVIPFQRDVVKGHSSGLWMLLAAVLGAAGHRLRERGVADARPRHRP